MRILFRALHFVVSETIVKHKGWVVYGPVFNPICSWFVTISNEFLLCFDFTLFGWLVSCKSNRSGFIYD